MKSKVFKLNERDKIEFTKEELKSLLDEIYNEGYKDGSYSHYYYQTPWKPNSPWYTVTTATGTSINSDSYKDKTFKYEPSSTGTTATCSKEGYSTCKGCD